MMQGRPLPQPGFPPQPPSSAHQPGIPPPAPGPRPPGMMPYPPTSSPQQPGTPLQPGMPPPLVGTCSPIRPPDMTPSPGTAPPHQQPGLMPPNNAGLNRSVSAPQMPQPARPPQASDVTASGTRPPVPGMNNQVSTGGIVKSLSSDISALVDVLLLCSVETKAADHVSNE